MKGYTALLELSHQVKPPVCSSTDNQKGSFIQRGSILSKLKAGLYFFFSAYHLMVLCIRTKLHEEIFNRFQDVERNKMLSFELQTLSVTLTFVRHG